MNKTNRKSIFCSWIQYLYVWIKEYFGGSSNNELNIIASRVLSDHKKIWFWSEQEPSLKKWLQSFSQHSKMHNFECRDNIIDSTEPRDRKLYHLV
jgi:hypothetical protein